MKKLVISAILFVALFLAGCNGIGVRGSGILKDDQRDIEDFESLEISGAYYVTLECGKEPSLQIIGDDNVIPLIKTEVRGSTLHIWSNKRISTKQRIKIKITTQNLDNIEASGASDIYVKNIDNDELSVEGNGAGHFRFSGKTEDFNIVLAGAVNLDAAKLQADEVRVELSGASNAEVYASEILRAEISGVGNIEYFGNPKDVKKRISGLGSITQK